MAIDRPGGRSTDVRPVAMPSRGPTPQREPPGAGDGPRVRPRGPRVYADRAGVEWRVEEVPAAAVPAAKGPACLMFHSEGAIRRVWRYPPNWRQLTDAELEVLSWGT